MRVFNIASTNMNTLRLGVPARSFNASITLLLIVVAAFLLLAGDALAIDGNYSSPYASQWDARSSVVKISDETLLGMILLIVNGALTVFFAVRHRVTNRNNAT